MTELDPPSVSSIPVKLALAGIKRIGTVSTRNRDPVSFSIVKYVWFPKYELVKIEDILTKQDMKGRVF